MTTEHSPNAPIYSKVLSNSNAMLNLSHYNRKDSTDSFNLYNGMIYDKPESPKRRSSRLVHKLLVVTLSVISLLILLLAMSGTSTMDGATPNSQSSSIHPTCAYDPIHEECGIDICTERDVDQVLSLRFGWSLDFVMLRKYDALNMLYSVNDENEILPNVLFLNTVHDESEFIEFENISIALGDIEMDIQNFCCYSQTQYQEIKRMFERFQWKQFDITFGNYTCLNTTDDNRIDVVLPLNDESQWLMAQWTNSFEDYLTSNGVDGAQSRRSTQDVPLFYSTFAIFYEPVSVDFLRELNTESTQEWQDIVVSYSKMNLRMT